MAIKQKIKSAAKGVASKVKKAAGAVKGAVKTKKAGAQVRTGNGRRSQTGMTYEDMVRDISNNESAARSEYRVLQNNRRNKVTPHDNIDPNYDIEGDSAARTQKAINRIPAYYYEPLSQANKTSKKKSVAFNQKKFDKVKKKVFKIA